MDNIEPKKSFRKPTCEFKVMRVREVVPSTTLVDTPELAVNYWNANIPAAQWFDPCKEAFVVLVLNTRRRVLGHNLVSLGTLDTCLAHSREVFRAAIVAAGSGVIIMHNHPSGDPTPSETDITVTRDLIRAGQLLKIEVFDHVIVGQPGIEGRKPFLSLRELGYFYS